MRRIGVLVVCALLFPAASARAWSWPVDGPVLQPFVFDRAHPYAGGQHRGIDIGAPAGVTVAAPAEGVVSFAGTVPGGGKTVSIETPFGTTATLVHLGSVSVARGALVSEGSAVGTIGPSGDPEVVSPYVHFGIRTTADPQGYLDPVGFLPSRAVPAPPSAEAPTSAAAPAADAAPAPAPVSVAAPEPAIEVPQDAPLASPAAPPAVETLPAVAADAGSTPAAVEAATVVEAAAAAAPPAAPAPPVETVLPVAEPPSVPPTVEAQGTTAVASAPAAVVEQPAVASVAEPVAPAVDVPPAPLVDATPFGVAAPVVAEPASGELSPVTDEPGPAPSPFAAGSPALDDVRGAAIQEQADLGALRLLRGNAAEVARMTAWRLAAPAGREPVRTAGAIDPVDEAAEAVKAHGASSRDLRAALTPLHDERARTGASRVTRPRPHDLPLAADATPGVTLAVRLAVAATALAILLALVALLARRLGRGRAGSRKTVRMMKLPDAEPAVARSETEARARGAGVAVRVGAAAPRSRRRVRSAGGHLRALPPPAGESRPDGQRDGRARDSRDGERRSRRRIAA